jgi:hypothetical protein
MDRIVSKMPKRSSKTPKRNLTTTASRIVQQGTAEPNPEHKRKKNPAAVALGRLGGLKGGKARAEALTAHRRRQIAKRAAQKRWSAKKNR